LGSGYIFWYGGSFPNYWKDNRYQPIVEGIVMDEHEAQRFIDEQRYQAELPFPVSAVFTHYTHSSNKNYALRSLQLVATAQSTIRYAAIVAAYDYATSHDPDETILNQIRLEWLGGKKPSFGTWYGVLMKLLSESGKSWKNQFVSDFSFIDREILEKKIQPLIHGRNVEIGHAEYYEALAMKHFVELQEENLFAVMEQFSFLARYPLAFVEVEDEYETPSPGTKQAVNICRGASHNFARYTVTPSHPLPPGIPFIWNDEYTGILTLSPFIIYGRATTDAEQKEKVKGVAHIQGLMVLNGVPKGAPVYTSVDAEAQFSLDSFEFPPKEQIQKQVESALKKGLNVPSRMETRLSEDEKELFVRTTDFVAPTSEEDRGKLSKRKFRLKTVLVSAILGVLILIAGFALYSHYKTTKVSLPVVQGVKSIAVLPFEDMSPGKDQDYKCKGIADAITNRLMSIEGLKVIATTSSFSFDGKKFTISEIGKILKVNTILEGSMQQEGNHLVITARLTKVDNDSLIWSYTFNRKAGEFLSIQDDISITVAKILKGTLKQEEEEALLRNYTKNSEVVDLYYQGLKYGRKGDDENAKKCFEKAIKKDSKFVPAYIELSDIYYGYSALSKLKESREDLRKQAMKYIDQAIKIDYNNAKAHAYKGRMLVQNWKYAEAKSEFNKALSLNPGSADILTICLNLQFVMTQWNESLTKLNQIIELDPLNPFIYDEKISVLTYMKKYDEAEKVYQAGKELFPSHLGLDYWMGRSYCLQSRYEEALEKYRVVQTTPLKTWVKISLDALLVCALAKSGERDKAREEFNNMRASYEYISPFWMALIYNGLGETDSVFVELEKGYELHDNILCYIKEWQEFYNLNSDPRFKAILKKIGLPEN
jgi:adenylate cyclase